MRDWVKVIFFFSSLSPLFFILLVQLINFEYLITLRWTGNINDWDFITLIFKNNFLALIFTLTTSIPNLVLLYVINRSQKYAPTFVTVSKVSNKNSDVLNYIATYLIPFVSFKTEQISDLLSFAILIMVLSIIYVNSNIIFINPLLLIFRFSIHQINDSVIVLCKGEVLEYDTLHLYNINKNIFLGVKR